jgi:hypothetical protein
MKKRIHLVVAPAHKGVDQIAKRTRPAPRWKTTPTPNPVSALPIQPRRCHRPTRHRPARWPANCGFRGCTCNRRSLCGVRVGQSVRTFWVHHSSFSDRQLTRTTTSGPSGSTALSCPPCVAPAPDCTRLGHCRRALRNSMCEGGGMANAIIIERLGQAASQSETSRIHRAPRQPGSVMPLSGGSCRPGGDAAPRPGYA